MHSKILPACLFISLACATKDCPILGPVYPRPTEIGQVFNEALTRLESAINTTISKGNGPYGAMSDKSSYSVQFFSIGQDEPLYDYHFTPDTIGDGYWHRPLTDFVPELISQAEESGTDPIDNLAWDQVTLGALASHLAGVPRDVAVITALETISDQDAEKYGFPKISDSEQPPCAINATDLCGREQFLDAVKIRNPIYLPNTTPVYSNTGFQLLAYAVESITGKSYQDMLTESIIDPLNLTRTSYAMPDPSLGVIPGPGRTVLDWWYVELGESTPAGGIYASTNDLSSMGRAILNSSLLPSNVTRGWMKPVNMLADIDSVIGRPWEIYRQHLSNPTNRIVDIYTKGGSVSAYESLLALVPDYGVGFSIFSAGSVGQTTGPIASMAANIILPALEEEARLQAEKVFAGTYSAEYQNSSITLATDPSYPGLQITSWINQGKDMMDYWLGYSQMTRDELKLLLYPTNLEGTGARRSHDETGREIAFRISIPFTTGATNKIKTAFDGCIGWGGLDEIAMAGYAIDELVFAFNPEETEATSCLPRFLDLKLVKQT